MVFDYRIKIYYNINCMSIEVKNNPDIFVHVPKTAGITLRGLLIDKYGPEYVYGCDIRSGRLSNMARQGFKADNSQREGRHKLAAVAAKVPPVVAQTALAVRDKAIGEAPVEAFPKAKAIIGHFAVTTFDGIPESSQSSYYTILREPLQRMASHYRYLQQLRKLLPLMRHWGENHPIDLPFNQFALHESLQNYQTSFTGENLGRYALVGTYEKLPEFFVEAGLLHENETPSHLNETTWRGSLPGLNDPGFIRDFKDYHAIDYAVYDAASN